MSRGCLNDSAIAAGVISWKVTRRSLLFAPPITSARCQAIASPSRSRSVASQMCGAFLASLPSRRACFSESSGTTYSGAKVFRSIPSFDFGRSRIWPYEASTLKPGPSIRSSVLAFVGDSTITRSCFASANPTAFHITKSALTGAPTATTTLNVPARGLLPRTLPAALEELFPLLPPEVVDHVFYLFGMLFRGHQQGVRRVHNDESLDPDQRDDPAL